MKKIINLLSVGTILMSSPIVSNIVTLQQNSKSKDTYINDRIQTTIKNQEVDEKYLANYDVHKVTEISVDVTAITGQKETGDFSKLFQSVALDEFNGEIYNFNWRKHVTNFNVEISNVPGNVRKWDGPMIEIDRSHQKVGESYIEGIIYGQLKLTHSSLNHLILHVVIYVAGASWNTGNWAHVWFRTGTVLSLVKQDS